MGWWDKAVSAAKSAVNKAVSAVKKVASTIVKTVSNTVKKVASTARRVADTIKKTVSNTVKKVSSSVKRIKNTIKESVRKVVNRVSEDVDVVKNSVVEKLWRADLENKTAIERIKEAAAAGVKATLAIVKEKINELDWIDKLLQVIKAAVKTKLIGIGPVGIDVIKNIYELATGKVLTEAESVTLKLKVLDWIVPLNTLSKLFLGKNLDGTPEEFGSAEDYGELALGLAIIVPVGKIGAVAGKLGIKAGTTLGLKGFMRFAVTKLDDAARLFKIINVDDQVKLIRKLLKTDEGVKVINLMLSKKALNPTLVKPTISLVNKAIAKSILTVRGFAGLLPRILKPKTILWGLTGMLGVISSAYGISFGTEWFAKEGLWEVHSIPLSDKLRDYRFEPTVEKSERIRKDIINLRAVLPKAQELVRGIAWLWPFTKDAWLEWADGIEFELDQIAEEFASIIIPELVVLPELAEATVRDIIDGDTIDVGLWVRNTITGKEVKLPEYAKTDHGRIRIVGINAPEKSPKGEILCSDVEIFNVEKKFADESRDRLLPLNDKKVILKIDPDNAMDTHGRILAVVNFDNIDIGLRQIKEGLACGYYREPHKYFNEDVYSEATLTAKSEGIGMWAGLEEVEKEEEKIKIKITSEPTNAKLFLDDISLHHNTPSDEIELSDVLHLFTLGKHVISAEKGGLSFMGDIEIVKGDNGTFHLVLETEPIPEVPTEEEVIEEELAEEIIEEEVEEEAIIEPVPEPEEPAEIPEEYTPEQKWALKEAFAKILVLTEGRAIMSAEERDQLIASFNLYTDGQKQVLNLLWKDLTFYTQGRNQLSADEYAELFDKYRMA